MKRAVDWEEKELITELVQGKELAKQLRSQLNASSSPLETRQVLLQKILSCYEKSLSMLNWSAFAAEQKPSVSVLEALQTNVNTSSPTSDASNKNQKESKKRKAQSQWTDEVKITSGTVLGGPFDDGYSWRKYGQKDILGSNFPRGYYRCTHRHTKGCLAMKQVQRSDEDPAILGITYKGRHTCVRAPHQAATSSPFPLNATSKQNKAQSCPKSSVDAFVNFGEHLEIKANKDWDAKENIFPSFSFVASGSENEEFGGFLDFMLENNFLDSLSPSFVSPATSESNYFSMSPCRLNHFGVGDNVHTSESDLPDIISTPSSVTNSPIGDLELPNVDFVTNFPFDIPELFA